jgi:iron-sulfur cluster assembly protein
MFTLTSAAAQQIQKAAQDSGSHDMALRVAARMEPDGSIGYGMGFDDTGDNDMRLEIEDVSVVIAEHHVQLLEDTVLDFVELESGEFNFIFINQREAEASAGGCASTGSSAGGCGSGGCGGGSCGSGRASH